MTRQIYGIQRESDQEWVREVKSGEVLRLWGEGLGSAPGQVWIPWSVPEKAGIPAEVLEWNPAYIIARVGRLDRNTIGTVRAANAGWEALAPFDVSVLPFDTLPPPPPPPPPGIAPTVTGYIGAYGEPVKITGTGFGSISGRVLQGGQGVEVLSWTDTEIVVTSRGNTAPMPDTFTVQRPDNTYYTGQARPVVPGVLRRAR